MSLDWTLQTPASTLLTTTIDPAILHQQAHSTPFLPSWLSPVDDDALLYGGFPYGLIASIAGARGTGKTLISHELTASHVLLNPSSQVAWVDTTGAFSPSFLHQTISNRLRDGKWSCDGVVNSTLGGEGEERRTLRREEIHKVADMALDRVQVMRVFDLVGITEAVAEVKSFCEGERERRKEKEKDLDKARDIGEPIVSECTHQGGKYENQIELLEQAEKEGRSTRRKRTETIVYDSTGESDEELFSGGKIESSPLHNTNIPSSDTTPVLDSPTQIHTNTGIGLLIVDSITPPVLSLLSKPSVTGLFKTEALALLTTLFSTLSHLAREFSICVLG